MKRIGDYTEEGAQSWFQRQTVAGLVLKITGVVIALMLFFGAIGFVAGWFNEAVKVISPANVKEQWRFAYDYDASLEAIATQWCSLKAVENAETNPDYKAQRISQRLATETRYAAVAAEYDGRLADAFRAKIVAPPDVPHTAPLLTEKTARLCP